jgi:hypothetical protein
MAHDRFLRGLGDLRGKNKADDQTIDSKSFGKDQRQNHSGVQSRLHSVSAKTSIANNANGKSGSKTRKTTRETARHMKESSEKYGCKNVQLASETSKELCEPPNRVGSDLDTSHDNDTQNLRNID